MDSQVPVSSRDEIGRLAVTFNRMAGQLKENQQALLEQERLKKELELCRRIQEELLPRQPLHQGLAEIRGISIPANEVGEISSIISPWRRIKLPCDRGCFREGCSRSSLNGQYSGYTLRARLSVD